MPKNESFNMLNITRRHSRQTRQPPRDLSEDSCSLFFVKNPRWLCLVSRIQCVIAVRNKNLDDVLKGNMPATYAFLERLLRSSGGKVCSGLVCVQKCTLFPLSPCFGNAEVSTRGECRLLWNNRVLLTPTTPHPYHPSTRLPV